MTRSHKLTGLLASVALALVATPALAQEESTGEPADMSMPTINVSGVDYAYVGLPTSVPAGTTLAFQNDGTEFHEMAVIKISDETTPLEELMALPNEETESMLEFVGFVSAAPGTSAEESVNLQAPGRYVALCFIQQGSDPKAFEAIGFDPSQIDENTDPSTLPPEVQELLASIESNPQHMDLGMIQEFTVTEAGTEVGPLPETTSAEAASE